MIDPRSRLPHHEQMADAQAGCVPCKLCGGQAVISDAGTGAGYYIKCSGTRNWRASTGCMIDMRRLGGWAYNVRDWWNRLHSTDATDGATGGGEVQRCQALVEAVRAGRFDALDAAADQWSESAGVQRMSNAIASVFEKYASQEIMDRFREKIAALMHLSFVEGAGQGVMQVADLATTPGGDLLEQAALVEEWEREKRDWHGNTSLIDRTIRALSARNQTDDNTAPVSLPKDKRA